MRLAGLASFAQQRLWLLTQLTPDIAANNIAVGRRISGNLDPARLANVIGEILDRHEVLRTGMVLQHGQLHQVIAASTPFHLDVETVGSCAEARRRSAELNTIPFDLSVPGLVRARLFRVTPADHVLTMIFHHAVFDGLSIEVLDNELSTLYEHPGSLPPLPFQYADISRAQHQAWERGAMAAGLAYWRRQLDPWPTAIQLPADRLRRPGEVAMEGVVSAELPGQLLADVSTFARQHGVTVFNVLLAGLVILIHRYTGATDIAVATPVSGRQSKELMRFIGMFGNTVLLRIDVSDRPAFTQLAARVRDATIEGLDHQHVPFEKAVEAVLPRRSSQQQPLFSVLAEYHRPAPSERVFAGSGGEGTIAMTVFDILSRQPTLLDLAVTIEVTEHSCEIVARYAEDLFNGVSVERLLRVWQTILSNSLQNPDCSMDGIELVAGCDRQLVLDAADGGTLTYPDGTLDELFSVHARRAPEAIAVRTLRGTTSYADLDAWASQARDLLRRAGVRPGDVVAVCMTRSVRMLAAILGVLKARAAYLMLDPATPSQRLRYILGDAQVTHALVDASTAASLGSEGVTAVVLGDRTATETAASTAAAPAGSAGDVAYVIYTSGSTGTPKGTAVSHKGAVRLVHAQEYATFGPGATFLQLASVTFDVSVLEVWGALTTGGTVGLIEDRQAFLDDPQPVIEALQATGAVLITPHFNMMAERSLEPLRSLSGLVVGGDIVSPGAVGSALAQIPDTRLVNCYGPTETAVVATSWPVTGTDAQAPTVPIGRPLPNLRTYVVDPYLQLLPAGIPGELCVGGEGPAVGYIGRPAGTAGAFVPDPWSGTPGGRLYRTGDLVRLRDDKVLEFLGRVDDQVKIRGHRVELEEIKCALASLAGVADSVVVATDDPNRGRLLIAYVVLREPALLTAGRLREHLVRFIPPYMIPAAFVMLEAIPLTRVGKVDRERLPAPDFAAQAAPARAPESSSEQVMCNLLAEVLGVRVEDPDADFFELGGHSLLAMRLAGSIRARTGVEVPLTTIFSRPTAASLAAYLDHAGHDRTLAASPVSGD